MEHLADGRRPKEREDIDEREAVLLRQRDIDTVVGRRRLELEVERDAEPLAERETPGLVDASAERRMERDLIRQYEADVAELLDSLSFLRLPLAVDIARLPEEIRGYGHIKAANAARVAEKRAGLLARWRAPGMPTSEAA